MNVRLLLIPLLALSPVLATAQSPDGGALNGGAPRAEVVVDGGAAAKAAPSTENMCEWGISKAMTERLGSIAEKDFPAQSRCKYMGMLTQKTVLDLNWTLDGKPQPPVRVSTRQCMPNPPSGNDPFVVEVPEEMPRQCPETAAFLAKFKGALVQEEPLDGNAGNHPRRPRPYTLLAMVVAVAVGLILWRRSREMRDAGSGKSK